MYDGKELKIYLNGTLRDKFPMVVEGEEGEAHSKGDVVIGGMPGECRNLYTDGLCTKGTRAQTHRELIREWLCEPKGTFIYIYIDI